jgi:hypothetical protein
MNIAIKDIDGLKPAQKIQLVDDILASLEDLPVSSKLRRELNRRDAEMDQEGGVSWSAVKRKMVIR